MKCSVARESLSARLDGEAGAVPSSLLDEHLAQCSGCRWWYAAATDVTRRVRVGAAPVVPDLTDQILAFVPDDLSVTAAEPDAH
ncbi:zf-HC2 domain-containing protein [Nocardia sp. 004]|uniref:zf-HC2 domain-containing protein n=1 Tax=Nocardia sp. 004 TaxID=3385978 RepID=UPI0039A054B7